MAHASRPFCVTKAACIDQAFSLSEFAIDTLAQYEQQCCSLSNSTNATEGDLETNADVPTPIDEAKRERIFQYQRQLLAAKKTASVANTKDGDESGPVPQLIATLRNLLEVYEEEHDHSTIDWRGIKRAVAMHPLFQDISSSSGPESLLLQLTQAPTDDLTAMGLVLLSLVTHHNNHEPIQVGPLLALWPIKGTPNAIIDYYAAAAAVHTERHELQAAVATAASEEPTDPMDESPATPATPATPTEEEPPQLRAPVDPLEAPDDAAASDSSDDDDDDDDDDDSDDDDDDDDDALDDEDTEDDDDAVLRQAMAMSMVVEEAARALDSLVLSSTAQRSPSPLPSLPPTRPSSPTNAMPDLPPWPEPPSPHEPHPTQLSDFGAVPMPQVIQHLLRYALQQIPPIQPRRSSLGVVTGVGAALFTARPEPAISLPGDPGLTLPLLVALALALLQQRDTALEQWRPRQGSEEPNDPEGDDLGLLSAEVLEHKGLLRKAAAAAHEAQARDAAAAARLRHASANLSVALPLLRHYIQARVRQWLTTLDQRPAMAVLAHLAPALASLWSLAQHRAVDDADSSVTLYKEAILLWGECIPWFYPTEQARWELLQASLGHANAASSLSLPLEQLSTLPASDAETEYYQFHILCRRLRVRDLLDASVAKPCVFTGDVDLEKAPPSEIDPPGVSARIAILGNAVQHLRREGTSSTELEYLYLALCHRCQAHALLLDGFYAHTDTESEDRPLIATAKSLSGDTVRVSSSPSAALQFDTTKCSDSIAVYSSSSGDEVRDSWICSVHQRASKVWGSILSTQHYSPKTGVHRWAVRLDKCERGHVFIGVATSQANIKTYVGGDKYGWGMIGTQALWHDRRKVRCSKG
jgi:hypothetical protein